MKALKVEMVDIQPMSSKEAYEKGYPVLVTWTKEDIPGYIVKSRTHPVGEWVFEDDIQDLMYVLSEQNDGTKILKEDVENFITDVDVMTVGDKTTVVNAHTLTGFDTVRHSSCVDPKNYSEELGKKYAMEEVINDLWSHLGFVLQWAKFGLKRK